MTDLHPETAQAMRRRAEGHLDNIPDTALLSTHTAANISLGLYSRDLARVAIRRYNRIRNRWSPRKCPTCAGTGYLEAPNDRDLCLQPCPGCEATGRTKKP